MANWFVRINQKEKGELLSNQVERKIYLDIETKREVLDLIKSDFPEYFSEKVPQRVSDKEFFYVNIYELDDYWYGYWTEQIPCLFCGENPVNRIDLKNNNYHGGYFCCLEHAEQYQENRLREEERVYRNAGVHGYIYKITHKSTGKVYIGKTVNHPAFRWFQHYKAESGSVFHEFMKKTKMSDWVFEVIDEMMEGNDSDLLKLESQYIEEFDSANPTKGFNTRK